MIFLSRTLDMIKRKISVKNNADVLFLYTADLEISENEGIYKKDPGGQPGLLSGISGDHEQF